MCRGLTGWELPVDGHLRHCDVRLDQWQRPGQDLPLLDATLDQYRFLHGKADRFQATFYEQFMLADFSDRPTIVLVVQRRSPSSSWRSCREVSPRAGLAAANRAGPGTITMPKQAPKVSGNSLNCCAVELRCTFAASGEWAECDKTKTKTASLNSLCFSNCYVHPEMACLMSHTGDEFSGKNPEDRFAGVRHLLSILP